MIGADGWDLKAGRKGVLPVWKDITPAQVQSRKFALTACTKAVRIKNKKGVCPKCTTIINST